MKQSANEFDDKVHSYEKHPKITREYFMILYCLHRQVCNNDQYCTVANRAILTIIAQ